MSKNLTDLRFAVRSERGMVSRVWRLWATKYGDVYFATRFLGGISKFSFHTSGICRNAFTTQHGAPSAFADRAIFKWKRLPTPPRGQGMASRVLWMGIPTDFLSLPPTSYSHLKETTWIDAAPAGGATYIDVAFTSERKNWFERHFDDRSERQMLKYVPLFADEALLVSYYHGEWENSDLHMPGNGAVADLIFSSDDPYETGRPIRISLGSLPTDGEAFVLTELGGYASSRS